MSRATISRRSWHEIVGYVLCVHCKGGKGRTGTLCCAWLLFTCVCKSLDEALVLFANRRTDEGKVGKMQGVETKGQVRILRYLEQFLTEGQLYIPQAIYSGPRSWKLTLQRPPRIAVFLRAVRLNIGLAKTGACANGELAF